MGLTFREFGATDADYELLAEIRSSSGDGPTTAEQLREEEQYWDPEQCHVRELILSGDKCIGADSQCKACDEEGDTHRFFFTLCPDYRGKGLDGEILENLIDKARNRGAARVTTTSRDDDGGRVQALERLGFSFWMSYVESKLDLEHFDPALLAAKIQQVEKLGIAIRSSDELSRDGVDWLRLYYDMRHLYFAEEYPTEPLPSGTYEEFREKAMN